VNKGEFATVLAERTELSKADVNRALDAILGTLTEAMADHEEVSFSGWGKFSAQRRKGREAHDPRNPRRTIHIAPGYATKFKAGSVLRREIQASLPPGPPAGAAPPQAGAATAEDGIGAAAPSLAESGNGRGERDRSAARWRPLSER